MTDAGVIFGSYAVTVVGIAAYAVWVLRRARRLAAQVPPEDRPWI